MRPKPLIGNLTLIAGFAIFASGCATIDDWRSPKDQTVMRSEMREQMMMDMHTCMDGMHQMHGSNDMKPMKEMSDMKNKSDETKNMHAMMMKNMKKCMDGKEHMRMKGSGSTEHKGAGDTKAEAPKHKH